VSKRPTTPQKKEKEKESKQKKPKSWRIYILKKSQEKVKLFNKTYLIE